MSKLLKLSIDVSKIKKEHIFNGEKGKYINVDVWINDEKDQYDNDCGVKQSYKVGESFESHYIGNGKKGTGWSEQPPVEKAPDKPVGDLPSDDLPFIVTILLAVGSMITMMA